MNDPDSGADGEETGGDADAETTASAAGVDARYYETDTERALEFDGDGRRAVVAQNREGYAMLMVRDADGEELERYYGFEMALDHAGELLGVPPNRLPVPEAAADMGM